MNAPRPYVRPMTGWWWKTPFLLRYMLRELTSPLVAVYALMLFAGVVSLSRGEGAYGAWLQWMASPWSVALHALLLAVFLYHTWSWFQIMPKTLPALRIGGQRVSAAAITVSGLVGALVCSAILLGGVAWLAR